MLRQKSCDPGAGAGKLDQVGQGCRVFNQQCQVAGASFNGFYQVLEGAAVDLEL